MEVNEALNIILSNFSAVGIENILISEGLDKVLAQDIYGILDLPPFDNSSMDGFALQAIDTIGAAEDTPIIFDVIEDIPAGYVPTKKIGKFQTARIVTGGKMPIGADSVVPLEDTNLNSTKQESQTPENVLVFRNIEPGDYVRQKGQDIKKGDIILKIGHRLRPQDIGFLAAQGIQEIIIYRRLRIGLLSTGDELLKVGEPIQSGKIFESNSYTLQGLISKNYCEVIHLQTSKDDPTAIREVLTGAVKKKIDLIISTGGVSMGPYDYVRRIIEEEGKLTFWRVNMRPGKPLVFGSYKNIPFIGLPGNPVSAFVGFEVFVRPVLEILSGNINFQRQSLSVELTEPINSDGRQSYFRANLHFNSGNWEAKLAGPQGSGNLKSLVDADALIIVPSGIKFLPVGSKVAAWFL